MRFEQQRADQQGKESERSSRAYHLRPSGHNKGTGVGEGKTLKQRQSTANKRQARCIDLYTNQTSAPTDSFRKHKLRMAFRSG